MRITAMRTVTGFGLAAVFALFGGCPQNPGSENPSPDPNAKPRLVPFDSKSAWLDYFRSQYNASRSRFTGGIYAPAVGGLGATNVAEDTAGAPSGESGGSYTTTNVQEVGVDEGDIVKSDGDRFYIARGRSLRIVDATPFDAMAEVGRLTIDDYISELYLVGNGKAIVLAQRFDYTAQPYALAAIEIWPPYYAKAQAVAYLVDVSDPAAPTVAQRVELDGSRVNSRVVDNRLLLVLSIVPDVPNQPIPLVGQPRFAIEDVMPKIHAGEASGDLVPWENWLHPEYPNGYYMTAVVALDTANLENVVSSVAILANAGTIYSSTDALYLTDTDYDVSQNYRERTAIHKFAFNDQGAAAYVASGVVSGRPLNQFSLGEHEGNLRIATHIQPTSVGFGGEVPVSSDGSVATAQAIDTTQATNAVFVLGESSAELVVKGSIVNIAPGENIYSARFMGNHGFLVTFRQIDPLFALDLADPTAPRIAGELKIPGFSDYLHPLGENHLIGIGRATATSPWGGTVPRGVQLSLFDVTDLSNPTLVQQIEVGGFGSSTEVSYDHKAFAFLADRNILALPAQLYPMNYNPYGENGSYTPSSPKSTILFYSVDPAVGFTAIGSLDTVGDALGYSYGSNRPAIIGDTAYAVNAYGVRAALLGDLATTKTLVLEAADDDFGPVYFDAGSGDAVGAVGAATDASAPETAVSGETVP